MLTVATQKDLQERRHDSGAHFLLTGFYPVIYQAWKEKHSGDQDDSHQDESDKGRNGKAGKTCVKNTRNKGSDAISDFSKQGAEAVDGGSEGVREFMGEGELTQEGR